MPRGRPRSTGTASGTSTAVGGTGSSASASGNTSSTTRAGGATSGRSTSGAALGRKPVVVNESASSSDDGVSPTPEECQGMSMEDELREHGREKLSFHADQLVLLKWTEDAIYYGKLKSIDHNARKCEVLMDDEKTGLADFSQIFHVSHILSSERDSQCVVCNEKPSDGQNEIVVCDQCMTGYHQQCHRPAIPNRSRREPVTWLCTYCKTGKENPYTSKAGNPFVSSRLRRAPRKTTGQETKVARPAWKGRRLSAVAAVRKMQAQARQKTPSPGNNEERMEGSEDSTDEDYEEPMSDNQSNDSNPEEGVATVTPRDLRQRKRSHQQIQSESDSPPESPDITGIASKKTRREPRIVLDQRHSRSRLADEHLSFQRAAGDSNPSSSPVKKEPPSKEPEKSKVTGWAPGKAGFSQRLSVDSDSSAEGEPAFKAPQKPPPAPAKPAEDPPSISSPKSQEQAQSSQPSDGDNEKAKSPVPAEETSGPVIATSQASQQPTFVAPTNESIEEAGPEPIAVQSRPKVMDLASVTESQQSTPTSNTTSLSSPIKSEEMSHTRQTARGTEAVSVNAVRVSVTSNGGGPARSTGPAPGDVGQLKECRRRLHEQWLKEKESNQSSPTVSTGTKEQSDSEKSQQGIKPEAPQQQQPEHSRAGNDALVIEDPDGASVQSQPSANGGGGSGSQTKQRQHNCSHHRRRSTRSSRHADDHGSARFAGSSHTIPSNPLWASRPNVDHFKLLRMAMGKPSENFREIYSVGKKSLGLVTQPEPFCDQADVFLSMDMTTVTPATDLNTMCSIFNAHHLNLARHAEGFKPHRVSSRRPGADPSRHTHSSHKQRDYAQSQRHSQSKHQHSSSQSHYQSHHHHHHHHHKPSQQAVSRSSPGQSVPPSQPQRSASHSHSRQEHKPSSTAKPTAVGQGQCAAGNEVGRVLVDGQWCPVREQPKPSPRQRSGPQPSRSLRDEVRVMNPELAARISHSQPGTNKSSYEEKQRSPRSHSIPVDPPSYYENPHRGGQHQSSMLPDTLTPEQAKHVNELYTRQQVQQQYNSKDSSDAVARRDTRYQQESRGSHGHYGGHGGAQPQGRSRSPIAPYHRDTSGRQEYPTSQRAPGDSGGGKGQWQQDTVFISDSSSYENSPQQSSKQPREDDHATRPSRHDPSRPWPRGEETMTRVHPEQVSLPMPRTTKKPMDVPLHGYPYAHESWSRERNSSAVPRSVGPSSRHVMHGSGGGGGRTYELHRASEPFILPGNSPPTNDKRGVKREQHPHSNTSHHYSRDEASRQQPHHSSDAAPSSRDKHSVQYSPQGSSKAAASSVVPGPERPKQMPCVTCGKMTGQSCASCYKVWYCSQECQKKSWRKYCANCNTKKSSSGNSAGAAAVPGAGGEKK